MSMKPGTIYFATAVSLAGALGACAPSACASEEADSRGLVWNSEWPRFRPVEYVVIGIVGPLAIAMYNVLPPQHEPHWIGGILFDDALRNAVRLRSTGALKTVRFLADATGVTSVLLVVGLDSFLVPMLRNGGDVATQLTLMDLESFALSSTVTFSLYDSVGRARPSYGDCQRDSSVDPQCGDSPTASFPSGHTSEVFTSAGLSCAHHTRIPLYNSRLADALACARDLTLATVDGALRIMGDRHYFSDVLAGAAIGFGLGYGMPTLLHYSAAGKPLAWVSLAPTKGALFGISAFGEF